MQTFKEKNVINRTNTDGSTRHFKNCVRHREIAGPLGCFDVNAIYGTGAGTCLKGKENIRKALAAVCTLKEDLQAQKGAEYITGKIMAWVVEWTLKATMRDGTKLNLEGR